MQQPDFWSNTNEAKKVTKEANQIRQRVDHLNQLKN